MEKKPRNTRGSGGSTQMAEGIAKPLAEEMGLEWVEVTLQKESRGKCLCIYVDKDGGLTLNDCEQYHKRVQPLLEAIDYDFLEVSSPGIDRPVKTRRDFEKNQGSLVEVKLYAPVDGAKLHRGFLQGLDEKNVTILLEAGEEKAFPLNAVAVVKPVIEMDEEE